MYHGDAQAEHEIESFWDSHPCGDHIVGGLHARYADDYDRFFTAYDSWRYRQEKHIPDSLERVDWQDRDVLELGLGQGSESEQIIRRGGRWSGLDLTSEAVERVRARVAIRGLPHGDIRQGSALAIPWEDDTFDIVFSHGVLHHIPDIQKAQTEIHRVLKPGGILIAMLYSRYSLNYLVSIKLVRRAVLATAYPLRRTRAVRSSSPLQEHLRNAELLGLRHYLRIERFLHRNTDGPRNPYSRVYSRADVADEFHMFELVDSHIRYMHAPPLPVHRLPGQRWLGWHLWVELHARPHEARAQHTFRENVTG